MRRIVCMMLFLFFLFLACSRQNKEILSSSELEDILYELYIGEGVLSQDFLSVNEKNKRNYLLSVLKKYDVTLQQYDSTLVWYAEHTDEYLRVYEKLVERLQKQQTRVQAELDEFNENRLSPRGDSVSLFEEPRSVVLYPFLNKRSWTTSLIRDKNYSEISRFYLNYSLPYKVDTTQLIVSLSTWDSQGRRSQVVDTLKGMNGSGQLTLFADTLLQRVEAKIELSDTKSRAYRIGLSRVDLWRVKYDSIPEVKIDTVKINKS